MAISPKPSDAKMPDDLIDDQNSEHEKEEQEYEEKDRDTTAPTTPEPPAEVDLMHFYSTPILKLCHKILKDHMISSFHMPG